MSKSPVLIANGQGFWGDSPLGPVRLVNEGPLHYLTLDYLAEVTMSIMQKLKQRDPSAGYATDFVKMLERILPTCKEKGICVVANAAGVNPDACLEAIKTVVAELGLSGVRIAVIQGDDILDELDDLMAAGETFTNMDTGETLAGQRDKVLSANVYIGAGPVAEALDQGADIILAGRVTDPSLVAGPLMHEFGWSATDYDQLAAATVAGHILECGAQCTGGNYVNWREVPDMARIGYPVVEAEEDGSFVVTKHEGTGGLVNIETVSSQLLYEMGDPKHYLTPDVQADFTTIKLDQVGENRVRVSGIKGIAPTDTYKVSISCHEGYKIAGNIVFSGPDAIDKAHKAAEVLFERLKMGGVDIPEQDRFVEVFGTNVCLDGIVPTPEQPGEVMLRVGARGADRNQLSRLGMELAPLATSGPPGVTGFAGGRPKASPIIGFWPALMDKRRVKTSVRVVEV